MVNLHTKNLEYFKSLNDFDKSLLGLCCNIYEDEDIHDVSESGINICNTLKETKTRLKTMGFTDEEKDNYISERLFEMIRDEIKSVFPSFYKAVRDNSDPERIIVSAVCKLEKPHTFKSIAGEKFTTKVIVLQDETDIYLGKKNLWDDLMSSDEFRVSDVEWLLKAIKTMTYGKIKHEYSF